ncbi:MAG TPA: pseudouridine synthase [Segetibacter sp.]|jgi:23S rRNA pseudouridine2457 synthase
MASEEDVLSVKSVDVNRYFIVHKPYNMVSQFVSSHKVRLLGDLDFNFPDGTHAVGRLDINSEGLLILTTNKKVTRLLFESEKQHERVYLVQVKKVVTDAALQQLRDGVSIRVKGGGDYITSCCKAEIAENPGAFINLKNDSREYNPSTWLLITLTEGKFRQVRKMVAAVNHQCKRLVRVSIENVRLGALQPGEVREVEEAEFFRQLCIDNY